MMMLEWIVLIPVILWLFGRSGGQDGRANDARSADRILDERFARGEIDADEYRARRSALGFGPEGVGSAR